ncbi:hypothetical protein [Vagococcus hydrophili]|uniref:Uncharacterized protein n=1 Tax=Vagococcus hydrophili TaxID=2714947 RepID=A0A6G8ARW4_9ENTE|nr:hypothetical protein [Vagococcus hydrophili]QIL47730.1 hypothetical protein G7082_03840 [Vagococcus hydrophili]
MKRSINWMKQVKLWVIFLILGSCLLSFSQITKAREQTVKEADTEIASSFWSIGYSWYYNTGEKLPKQPVYGENWLLEIIQKGDIIYEATGFGGLTGHMAIVGARRS